VKCSLLPPLLLGKLLYRLLPLLRLMPASPCQSLRLSASVNATRKLLVEVHLKAPETEEHNVVRIQQVPIVRMLCVVLLLAELQVQKEFAIEYPPQSR